MMKDPYLQEAERRGLLPPAQQIPAAPDDEGNRQVMVTEAIKRGLVDEDPYAAEARKRGLLNQLTDAETAGRRARGEQVAEALPYRGFWDRAKQTFTEWRNLDQNTLQVLYRKFLAGQRIDPATGEKMTEDQLRQLHNLERERDEYLLAGHEPAEGFLEHAGDLAGIIAKESTAPTALMAGPVGTGKQGIARVGTMAAAGGSYEGVAATMEQIAREGEITDPRQVAIRAGVGAVAAPVLDVGLRGVGKAGETVIDQTGQLVQRMRGRRAGEPQIADEALPQTVAREPAATQTIDTPRARQTPDESTAPAAREADPYIVEARRRGLIDEQGRPARQADDPYIAEAQRRGLIDEQNRPVRRADEPHATEVSRRGMIDDQQQPIRRGDTAARASDEMVAMQAPGARVPRAIESGVTPATVRPARVASPEAAADTARMMPGSRYVGMIDDAIDLPPGIGPDAPRTGKPIRREDVLRPFLKALDVPLYQGRVKGKSTLGFYLPQKEAVRVKNKSDLEVAAHELAHLIDDRVFKGFSGRKESTRPWLKGPNAREYAAELKEISYDHNKVYEGFAEFVRLWMTQPEKAMAAAPKFARWWDEFVQRHEYGPAIRDAQKGMQSWFNQDALSRAASKIGEAPPVTGLTVTRGDQIRQSIWDDFHGIYRMERELLGSIEPAGPYETARLTRGAAGVVEGALKFGYPVVKPDGSHAFRGKGLEEILKPVSANIEDWTLYAVGRSARELMKQGREKLFTPAEIEAMLKLETPAFKKAFDEYQVWNKGVVDFAEAKGLINPETRKLWQRTEYLPFYRADQAQTGGARRGGVEGHWSGIHRLTGGTGNIKDVLGNMIQNASMLITASLRNEARMAVADMANKVKGGGRFMVKIPKDTRAISVDKEQIQRMVYNMLGLSPADVRIGNITPELSTVVEHLQRQFAQQADFMQFWKFAESPKGSNVIAVMRQGKPEFYEVADPLLMRSMESFNRKPRHWLVGFLNGVRRIGQTSITMTPDFMAANFARSDLYAMAMTRHGYIPFVDGVRGLRSRLMNDPNYREYIANGGGFSSHLRDEDAFKAHLKRFYSSRGINPNTVLDTPGKMLYALETLGESIEIAPRLGEFASARQAGAHPRHAAYLGSEIGVDYRMRGDSEVMSFFYDSIIFLKAGMNGLDRFYRGMAHDVNHTQIAARVGALGLMSMTLYSLNRGNPQYEQMEDWDRDMHWHFFVPKKDAESLPENERWHHFRYPKIWEIGAVASVSERTMQNIMDSTPAKQVPDMARIAMDLFKLEYMPQAFGPIYEQMLNRNRFTDRPIVPPHLEGIKPFAQATPYTSRALQDAGIATRDMPDWAQISPVRMEHLLRGYFNTWAMYGLSLADAVLYDDQPEMRTDQYPVVRRFFQDQPARGTRYETAFYDMLKEATDLRRTMRYLDRMHRHDVADEIAARPQQEFARVLDRYQNVLSALHTEMREVQLAPDMTPAEKRERLDNLQREKNDFLREIVEDMTAQ